MKVKRIEVNGHKFLVRPGTMDSYVAKEAAGYRKKIRMESTDRWLDGGANIGAFAVHCAEAVEFIHCLEPEPANFLLLKENTKELENVTHTRAAITGGTEKQVKLYLNNATNMGAHSQFVQRGRTPIDVPAININELLRDGEINALKLDVEGAEYGILRGIKSSHWRRLRKVIFEFHFAALKDKKHDMYKEILILLKQEGFKITGLRGDEGMKNWHTIVSGVR